MMVSDSPEEKEASKPESAELQDSPLSSPFATLGWKGEWGAFVTAVQFLTRIPVSFDLPTPTDLARSPLYFPLVGGLIGIVTAGVAWTASFVWPVWVAVVIALAVEARLTGAFHEDAVADFCDAFGGGWSRDEVLTILKDSRIGTYGTIGLGLAVALRIGATTDIIEHWGWLRWWIAIIGSSCVARLMIIVTMGLLPPVEGRESLSRDAGRLLTFADQIGCCLRSLPILIPFLFLLPVRAIVAAVALALLVQWFTRYVGLRLKGVTGDCLGCICYLSHVVVLLAIAARWQL